MDASGNDKHAGPPEHLIAVLRDSLLRIMGTPDHPHERLDDVVTELHGEFLDAWRCYSEDPDLEVVRWLFRGAPAGVMRHSLGPRVGIVPPSGEKVKELHEATQYEPGWKNYATVEEDPAAAEEVKTLASSPYVDVYDDYETLLRWCTSEPVIRRLKMSPNTSRTRPKDV